MKLGALAVVLLVATLSISFFEAEAGPPTPVDSLMISATSPHQADGVDFSDVVVSAFDSDNNPVIGANIFVTAITPPDTKEVFNTIDNVDGTYSAEVTSTVAGTFTIRATDEDTGVTTTAVVVFLPGPVVKVEILEIIQPRESESQTTAELVAVALDAFENAVGSPDAQMLFSTNLGNVASVNENQNDNFIAEIFSADLGTATITVTETNTGFMDVAQIDFTPLHLVLPPDGSLGVGDTFSMPIVLYVPGPAASPPWDVSLPLDYDTSVFQVVSVEDGDPGDLVPLPALATSGTGLTLTSQSAVDPFPFDTPINFAVVTFQVRSLGPTFNSILVNSATELNGGTETTVAPGLEVNAGGSPVTVPPSADVTVALTVKPTNNVCIKFWIAPGAYANDAEKNTELAKEKKKVQKIYDDNVKNSCPKVKFHFDEMAITAAQWTTINAAGTAKANDEDSLDEFPKSSTMPTEEEKELLKIKLDSKDGNKCINVYIVPGLSDGSIGEAFAPGRTTAGDGVVITPGKQIRAIAHEAAHFLGGVDGEVLRDNKNNGGAAPADNLMAYANQGEKLTELQCKKIADGKKSWESVAITPDVAITGTVVMNNPPPSGGPFSSMGGHFGVRTGASDSHSLFSDNGITSGPDSYSPNLTHLGDGFSLWAGYNGETPLNEFSFSGLGATGTLQLQNNGLNPTQVIMGIRELAHADANGVDAFSFAFNNGNNVPPGPHPLWLHDINSDTSFGDVRDGVELNTFGEPLAVSRFTEVPIIVAPGDQRDLSFQFGAGGGAFDVSNFVGESDFELFVASVETVEPALITVPDVVGLSEADAASAIIGAGLPIGTISSASSDTVPAGDVISQTPIGGSMVAPATFVDFVVSTGPSGDMTAPDPPIISTPTNNQAFTHGDFTVSGTAEPGSSVDVFADNVNFPLIFDVQTTTADDNGDWSVTFWLDDGVWDISATATDASDNISLDSEVVQVTVDNPNGFKVIGNARQDFLDLIAECTKQKLKFAPDGMTVISQGNMEGVHSPSLRALKDFILNSDKMVVVDARADPLKDIEIDGYPDAGPVGGSINGLVDMSDVNSLPDDVDVDRDANGVADSHAPDGTWIDTNNDGIPDMPNPTPPNGIFLHAETKCASLAHILGERSYSVENNADYDASHDTPAPGEGGQGAGNAVKGEVPADKDNNVTVKETTANGPPGTIVVNYDDGSMEKWVFGGADGEITIIEYLRATFVRINDVSQLEKNTIDPVFEFTATRYGDLSVESKVDFMTADRGNGPQDATAGADYFAQQGTLTFAPGQTEQKIMIIVNGEFDKEEFETFLVKLSNCVNCAITRVQGEGEIQDDDSANYVHIENDFGIEGKVFKFNVIRQGNELDEPSSVDFMTTDGTRTMAGKDYTAKDGTITFGPGETLKTIEINVLQDNDPEPFDVFHVVLSRCMNCKITDASGQGTITEDVVLPKPPVVEP